MNVFAAHNTVDKSWVRELQRIYNTAVILLKRGEPIPVDMQARLIEAGYNIQSMERIYGA